MTKFYWHVHHDVLMETSDDIQERVAYILAEKPKDEIPLRLELLREVRGPLPVEYDRARVEWNKALFEYDRALFEYDKARVEWKKALFEYDKWMDQVDQLHERECPNCPWDGNTIFSGK
jgi:hypothetical protein